MSDKLLPIPEWVAAIAALLCFAACSQDHEAPPRDLSSQGWTALPTKDDSVSTKRGLLGPEDRLEAELAPKEIHTYHLKTAADHFLHIVVDQQGVDVLATLLDPAGKPVIEMDRPIDDQGPEPLLAVTDRAGPYLLTIEAIAGSGSYEVWLAEHRLALESDRARATATAIYSKANHLYTKRDYAQAKTQFDEAAQAWEALRDSAWQAESLLRLGQSHARLQKWQTAITSYQEAAVLFKARGDARWQAIALHHIGLAYYYLGDLGKAIETYREALPLRKEALTDRGTAITYHALGQAFQRQDEVQQSLDYYARALDLFESPRDRSRTTHNLGVLYLSLGKLAQARDSLVEAERISAEIQDLRRQAVTLNQLGELHRRENNLDLALQYYEKALNIRRSLKDQRGEATSLANIGRIKQARNEQDSALNLYLQAMKILKSLKRPRLEARVLLNLGSLHLDKDEPEAAIEYFDHSLKLYQEVGDPTGNAEGLLGLAKAERQRGNLTAARKASEEALTIFESVRPKAVSYNLRSSFFATVQRHFEFHIDLLMELDRLEPDKQFGALALKVSEQARARSLLDLLTESGAQIRKGADPTLLERERVLQGQINAWEKRRLELRNDPRGRPEQLATVEESLREALQKLVGVQGELRTRHPHYADFNRSEALSSKAIQQQILDEETLLLQYWLGDQRSFVWAVNTDSINSFELPGRQEIERIARRTYALLIKSNRQEARGSLRNALCELSEKLLAPIADLLPGKRLLVVADGTLQFIPFAALPKPDIREGCLEVEPLIVEHEITYLPSTSVLSILRDEFGARPVATHQVAVVADPVFSVSDQRLQKPLPNNARSAMAGSGTKTGSELNRLPYTLQEAEAILELADRRSSFKAVGFEANKKIVTDGLLDDYRYVHFATHGILDTSHPELSGIVLSMVDSQGHPQDGFLRAHEIFNLELPSELIVLSACQTALGEVVRGEGLVGLTRGFMYAGASRVMVSLWNVSDAGTAELMESFYKGLLERDLRPVAALREAQVAMLSSEKRKTPYYWAGFVIQGEWR